MVEFIIIFVRVTRLLDVRITKYFFQQKITVFTPSFVSDWRIVRSTAAINTVRMPNTRLTLDTYYHYYVRFNTMCKVLHEEPTYTMRVLSVYTYNYIRTIFLLNSTAERYLSCTYDAAKETKKE